MRLRGDRFEFPPVHAPRNRSGGIHPISARRPLHYLSCYFFGGMVGSAALAQILDRFGWPACVAGIGASLAIAALLASELW